MARRRKGRALNGVLILDKPQEFTSNGALQKVRWLYQAQKAGHTGALDPLATGVLPICFGEATKFSRYLLDADKAYYTTATLGETRDTGDSEGEVLAQCDVPDLSESMLEQVYEKFRGDIMQVPSMFSALKHEGRPLYEYARKGIEIERPARPISIFQLDMTGFDAQHLALTVRCSKGTYIRSLVEDIGKELGCGAHVSMLRRFKAGHFSLDQAVDMETLLSLEGDLESLDAFLLPTDALLPDMPAVFVNNSLGRSLLHGQAVRISPSENSGLLRLYIWPEETVQVCSAGEAQSLVDSGTAHFCGVVELDAQGQLQPKRLQSFDPEA